MPSPEETTVLVTGASSGIGKSIALYLARKGYPVIGTSRALENLASLRQDAEKLGVEIETIELDVNSDDAVAAVMPELVRKHDGIDVLVNNAGYGLWGPTQSLSIGELRDQMETNFFAPFQLSKAVLAGMIENGYGKIINVSSVLGRLGTPFNGAYVASKFALEGMSESMRIELKPFGVHVTLIEPGLFDTNFFINQVQAADARSPGLPYSRYLARYDGRRGRSQRFAKDPIKIARLVHKIVRSNRPRFRYQVGPEARLGVLAMRFLPERLFRSLLSRATLG